MTSAWLWGPWGWCSQQQEAGGSEHMATPPLWLRGLRRPGRELIISLPLSPDGWDIICIRYAPWCRGLFCNFFFSLFRLSSHLQPRLVLNSRQSCFSLHTLGKYSTTVPHILASVEVYSFLLLLRKPDGTTLVLWELHPCPKVVPSPCMT